MRPLQIFVTIEFERRAKRALLHSVKDVLDVDEVPAFQPKINANPQKLFRQHGHVEAVAVEPAQIATVKPFEQARRNAPKLSLIHI